MERKETKEIHVYIYYRYEDRQWLLDFISISTKESLYIAGKKLQIVYANIFLHCDVQCSSTKDVIYYALEKVFFCIVIYN